MTPRLLASILLGLSLATPGCTAGLQEQPVDPAPATSLVVGRSLFERTSVERLDGVPPRFELVLIREMPTPGWSFRVDELSVATDQRRIIARVSELAPSGMLAQVMTPTECRLPLGKLEQGSWVLELWLARRGAAHRPIQAFVLDAR